MRGLEGRHASYAVQGGGLMSQNSPKATYIQYTIILYKFFLKKKRIDVALEHKNEGNI